MKDYLNLIYLMEKGFTKIVWWSIKVNLFKALLKDKAKSIIKQASLSKESFNRIPSSLAEFNIQMEMFTKGTSRGVKNKEKDSIIIIQEIFIREVLRKAKRMG